MSAPISISMIGRILVELLERADREIEVIDQADGASYIISPEDAAAADGFLPVFLRAAEGIWREATGKSFGIYIRHSATATLGYQVDGIASGPASVVMLCMIEAIELAAESDRLLINDLCRTWMLSNVSPARPALQAAG